MSGLQLLLMAADDSTPAGNGGRTPCLSVLSSLMTQQRAEAAAAPTSVTVLASSASAGGMKRKDTLGVLTLTRRASSVHAHAAAADEALPQRRTPTLPDAPAVSLVAPSHSSQQAAPPVAPTGSFMIAAASAAAATEDEAYALVERANRILDGGLHRCSAWAQVRDLYHHAAALFASLGMHAEAAVCFNHSAGISRVFGTPLEVATAVGFAVDSFRFCDPLAAAALLREQAEIYQAEGGLRLQVARCYKDAAEIHERVGNVDEAIVLLKLALENYPDDGTQQQQQQEQQQHQQQQQAVPPRKMATHDSLRRHCLERLRHLLVAAGNFHDAAALFEEAATTAAARGLPQTSHLMLAVLAYVADAQGERLSSSAGIPRAKKHFSRFQDQDPALQRGREHSLLRGVLEAFDKGSLERFDAASASFTDTCSSVKPSATLLALLARCRENLFQYLLPYL